MLILVTTTRTIKTLHSRKLASEVHSSKKKIQALNISARMSNSICLTPVCSLKPTNNPGLFGGNSVPGKVLRVNEVFQNSKVSKFQSLQVKADSNPGSKPNSILCANCDGNGAVACSQCKGHGVNSVDHFNGQFKAGGLCWLCRGKREMLCGDCNGAGFMGGFMSTFDS